MKIPRTAKQALEIWQNMSEFVTYQSLNDNDRHQVVHELAGIIRQGLVDGEITANEI